MKVFVSILITLCLVGSSLFLTGCGKTAEGAPSPAASPGSKPATGSPAASPNTKAVATSGNPTPTGPVPAPTNKPSPTPTSKQPAITTVSFNLALATAQEYTEYTLPVFLRRADRLHLYWAITTGGDHLSLAFLTPDGELVSVENDGSFARNASAVYPYEKLFYKGDVVFSPPAYGWNEGYYLFQLHIRRGDAAVGGKVYYWIE